MGGSQACWVGQLLHSSIGKKAVMALTGAVLFVFIVGHLAGNLQAFVPDHGKTMDEYAHMLKSKPALLWGVRLALLATVLAHIACAVRLALENRAARPVAYQGRQWREASYASRTMMISGPLIALYAVYHLLHLTTGHAHPTWPKFRPESVYANLVAGFQSPLASGVYIVAMVLLGTHLAHGLWSMVQTLGVNHPKYNAALRCGSVLAGAAIAAGYIAIPISVMAGILE
jgi:succinate dehydrogenase / fumarate reductase cytochrome b subunit